MSESNVAIIPQAEPEDETVKDVGGVTGAQLKQYIERIERLEEEKK